jgi:hypothetical protein
LQSGLTPQFALIDGYHTFDEVLHLLGFAVLRQCSMTVSNVSAKGDLIPAKPKSNRFSSDASSSTESGLADRGSTYKRN